MAAAALCAALAACGGGSGGAGDARGGDTPPPSDAGPDAGAADAADGAPDAAGPDADGGPDAEPGLDENFGVEETEGHPDCEGLHESHCMLPFPSDYWLDRSGGERSLRFGATTLPENDQGQSLTPEPFERFDGYGVASSIYLQLPGMSLEGTVPVFDPEASLEPDAKTVILNAETGERVPHWTEPDYLTLDAETPLFVLRPAVRLKHDTRYVVAVRGIRGEDGEPLEASRGFRALRDREASRVVGVHARRQHFEEAIFPLLADHGLERDALQLAWDFTTMREESATGLLRSVRDELLDAIGEQGPDYTIESVEQHDGEWIDRIVTLTAEVPSFLTNPDEGVRRILRDEDGQPVAEGFEEVTFTFQVPHALADAAEPGAMVQYGHGFLGSKGEADNGWLREMADREGFVILAANMQGMDENARSSWVDVLTEDAGRMPHLAEAPLQGIANHLALVRLMKGRFLDASDPAVTRDGEPLYDPDRIYYYGNSQGGTLGGIIMSITTDLERGVLGVPGGDYPLLLHRSTVFQPFADALSLVHSDPVELALILAVLGTGFVHADPLAYIHRLDDNPFPDTPSHEALLHVAKEDAQVHNQVSYILGRAAGARLMTPAVRPVWGLPEQPYPWSGTALVEHDFGMPDDPDPLRPPPEENDTHQHLRKSEPAQEQMMHFLETGELVNPCDGPCDPD